MDEIFEGLIVARLFQIRKFISFWMVCRSLETAEYSMESLENSIFNLAQFPREEIREHFKHLFQGNLLSLDANGEVYLTDKGEDFWHIMKKE